MELVLPGLLRFDPQSEPERERQAAAQPAEKLKRKKRLFCALCKHPITHQDERIEVNGDHEHTCTNPYGFTYTIGCFREAAGCVLHGAATDAHSWFRGYAWQLALCASCHHHLGWRFTSPGDSFYGLIVSRLSAAAGTGE